MPAVLTSLSDALADMVAAVGPGVVRVDARERLPGSGIIWSDDGVVVTAHHVVERDENISLGLADGQTVTASLVGRDPTTDLAVLRAQSTGLTPPEVSAIRERFPAVLFIASPSSSNVGIGERVSTPE